MKSFTRSLALCTLTLFFAAAALGQQTGTKNKKEEDPFREDPLFSRSLSDLLRLPSDSSGGDGHEHHYFGDLYSYGLDHEATLEAGPYSSSALYGTYPSLPMLHYNRVNGLFLGVRKERMQWYHDDWLLGIPNLNVHGMLGYAFSLADWQYGIGLERFLGDRRHVLIGGEYHSATTTDDYWRVGLNETSFTSFFGGYDYLDYYKQQGWGAWTLVRSRRLFEGGVAYNSDRYSSLDRQTGWALFGAGGRYRPNPPVEYVNGLPVEEVDISALTVSASFNPKRLVLERRFTFSAALEAEFADPGLGRSDYSYERYQAELLTFYNFERGGMLKHRLRIGSITGEAPFMKAYQLGGVGSLRAIPYKSLNGGMPGNQMILSTTEVHFGSPDFGDSDWIDFDELYLSLFLDSGWTGYSPELEEGTDPFAGFDQFRFGDLYHNAGVGLGSSLVRCELAWDLENTSRAPVLWIRFNPTF